MKESIKNFIQNDSFPGILLLFFTILALICANNNITSTIYENIFNIKFDFFDFEIESLLFWINEALMVIFFLCVGLELKYEIIKGQLQNIKAVSLPIFGAIGGMISPAIIFIILNYSDDFALQGWAIPTATDIAFAVGVLILLGKRVSISLKLFLLSLAIFDDMGAILIIALFYTSELSMMALFCSLMCVVLLFVLNLFKIYKLILYIFVGFLLWLSMLKSGIHPTISGIILSIFIPFEKKDNTKILEKLNNDIKPCTMYFILPLFAFANAGVNLSKIDFNMIFSGVSLGIFLGLFFGKQIGVFLFSYISIKLRLAKLPQDSNFAQLYGVCILTGIGFTMSLFIDGLAYQHSNIFQHADKLAILLASLTSAIVGFIYINLNHKRSKYQYE